MALRLDFCYALRGLLAFIAFTEFVNSLQFLLNDFLAFEGHQTAPVDKFFSLISSSGDSYGGPWRSLASHFYGLSSFYQGIFLLIQGIYLHVEGTNCRLLDLRT